MLLHSYLKRHICSLGDSEVCTSVQVGPRKEIFCATWFWLCATHLMAHQTCLAEQVTCRKLHWFPRWMSWVMGPFITVFHTCNASCGDFLSNEACRLAALKNSLTFLPRFCYVTLPQTYYAFLPCPTRPNIAPLQATSIRYSVLWGVICGSLAPALPPCVFFLGL